MKWSKKAKVLPNKAHVWPPQSFYNLNVLLNNGQLCNLYSLKHKKILLVNTASDCGYTAQYRELQQLYQQQKDRLCIIAFPANDFGRQEKSSNEAIAAFCTHNYSVTFPLAIKSVVVKNEQQHPVFQWLSHAHLNGWNNQAPEWNFSKYLIDEQGVLLYYFGPAVSPLSDVMAKAIDNKNIF